MKISSDRLRVIGKMIGIYREERRGNSQNCWTQKRFCLDVCSTNTLKSIEKGGIARSIDVYKELVEKLDFNLGEFPVIDNALTDLTNDLYEAIEFFRIDDILKIINKIIRVLTEISNYIYYSELLDLFNSLKEHYLNDAFITDSAWKRYLIIMYDMPTVYTDLYRFLIYTKIKARGIYEKTLYNNIIKEITLENSEFNVLKIALLDYYYISGKFLKMKTLISNLEKILYLIFDYPHKHYTFKHF